MAKALLFSDLHLHNHKGRVDRLYDCLKVLDWIFETAKNNNCKYLFFLGDLFHERAKIDVMNYLKTFEVFMKHMSKNKVPKEILSELVKIDKSNYVKAFEVFVKHTIANQNLEVFLLLGNHDMYHKEKWNVNSIRPFSAIPSVHIIDNPTRIVFEGLKIDWMPYTENPVKELAKFKEENNGAGDILMGHMSVHGAKLNNFFGTKSDVIVEYDNDMVPVDVNLFNDWKMTFLGHYHGAQKLNDKVEYVGSPLQLNFGEAFEDKHIIVLDLETLHKEYVVNTFSPRHLIVSTQDIENEAYNLNNNFVRLIVDDVSNKELLDISNKINNDNKVLSFDWRRKEKKSEDTMVIKNSTAILNNTDNMLENYIKDKGVPDGLDSKKLLEVGKQCLSLN